MPLSRSRFVSFVPRVKHVGSYSFELPSERLGGISSSGGSGINNSNKLGKLPTEELMAYSLARHFKSLGPKSKLCKNDASAQALIEVSAFYNSAGRHEEAKAYAHSACAAARQDSCTLSLALAQVIETQTGLQANAHAGPDVSALATYKQALEIIEWRWGKGHCFAMALHDRMAAMYIKAKKPEQALEFHDLSLEIALKSLGKHHVITAGYLVKVNFGERVGAI